MNRSRAVPHFVHVFPGFGIGGAQVRTIQLMNHLGGACRHTVLSLDGDVRAGARASSGVSLDCMAIPRTPGILAMGRRLWSTLKSLQPDLLLTYNWGSIEAAAAGIAARLCPVIHTEDGFNADEALRPKRRRVLARRIALRGAYRLVAPSLTLFSLMRDRWRLPSEKVAYIPNGIDIARFRPRCAAEADEIAIGSAGSLTALKRHSLLIDLCASLETRTPFRLLIAGDGPERAALEAQARARGLAGRVTFLGHVDDPAAFYRSLDIFALTSRTEQMPLSLLEAMASGLPVVATDAGDVRRMVAEPNRAFITNDPGELRAALRALLDDAPARHRLGYANRARCAAEYDIARMCDTYTLLYESALGAQVRSAVPC